MTESIAVVSRPVRSWLFVPGDSDRKLEKARETLADALILDLEDAVAPANKTGARDTVRRYLEGSPRPDRASQLWVRINPLDEGGLADLALIVGGNPDGIVLPKARGPLDAARLGHALDVLEVAERLTPGSIRILPVATETPDAIFRLGGFADMPLPRLYGLTWGAEDLSTALGAATNRDATGGYAQTYRLARSLVLLAAKAARVEAVESVYPSFKDLDGLAEASRAAYAEGFTGALAIHPAQVAVINAAYMPSPEAIAHAHRVVDAFAQAGGGLATSLDGQMLDAPHLKQAQAILARAQAFVDR